jgi:hypothetical protein
MRIPASIRLNDDDGYSATGRPPLTVTALGATREQALARLREAIIRRSVEGAVLPHSAMEVPDADA